MTFHDWKGATVPELVRLQDAEGEIGMKAARLAELARAGFPIPTAFVVPRLGGTDEVEALRDSVDQVLGSAFAGKRVVVRSSASDEDRAAAVAPGVYETMLGLRTTDAVLRAVRFCLDSLGSADAVAYRSMNQIDCVPVMSVIVQEVVECEVSGVLYTRSPVTDRAVMAVEWKQGLGTEIVAGVGGARLQELGRSESVVARPEEWTCTRETLWDLLRVLGHVIEQRYGCPQDVEWGYRDGRLYVFQTRPASLGSVPVPRWPDRPHTPADDAEIVSRGYAIGVVPAAGQAGTDGSLLTLAVVETLPSADGVRSLLPSEGVIVRDVTVLSHAAAMCREVGVPVVGVDEAAFRRLGSGSASPAPLLLDAVNGSVTPLADLPPVERKKAVFAWARHRARRGHFPEVSHEEKYEAVVFDPPLQGRLLDHLVDNDVPRVSLAQTIYPFDFPDRQYCGIGARIQVDRSSGASRVQFKYARPLPDRPYRFDQEVAFAVADVDEGRRLLAFLGYREFATQERRVDEFRPAPGVRICVNAWPGAAQRYVGIESTSVSRLEKLLAGAELGGDAAQPLDGKDLFALLGLGLEDLRFASH